MTRPSRDGGVTAPDDLSDRVPTDTGRIDPYDPHDCGGERFDEARSSAGRENDRTGGSGSETGECALPGTHFVSCDDPTTYTCGVYVVAWPFLPFGPALTFLLICFDLGRPFVLFMRQNRRKWMTVDGGCAGATPLVQTLTFGCFLLSREAKATTHAQIRGRVRLRRMTGLPGLVNMLGTMKVR